MLERVDVGTQDLDLYELTSEKALMANPSEVAEHPF
jgi:hypothetical protein